MLSLLKRESPAIGTVYFRGTLCPRAEEFAFLERQGITIRPGKPAANMNWSLRLDHPRWGAAEMAGFKESSPPPAWLLRFDPGLSDEERTEAASAGVGIGVRAAAKHKFLLRDRKNLLRFMRAILGDDGVVVCDEGSRRYWSRRALDDELAHDADLDVSSIYTIHAVTNDEQTEGPPYWVHTHGLAESGAFDMDILGPSGEGAGRAPELLRALAFAALAGDIRIDTPSFDLAHPGGAVRLVPVEQFHRIAAPAHQSLRDNDENHSTARAVLCEPVGRGLFARFTARVRPARLFTRKLPEHMVLAFSHSATELMADRARKTLGIFGGLIETASGMGLPVLAKIGYKTDHARSETDREHLWFQVHGISAAGIDATLESQPFGIARMRPGQREVHPVGGLTEWMIMTPLGPITPSDMRVAQVLRHNPEVLRAMAMAMGGGE